jgi:hypothetical protein
MLIINTMFFFVLFNAFSLIVGSEIVYAPTHEPSQIVKLSHEIKRLPTANKQLSQAISKKISDPNFLSNLDYEHEKKPNRYRQEFFALIKEAEDLLYKNQIHLQKGNDLLASSENENCNDISAEAIHLKHRLSKLQVRHDELHNLFSFITSHKEMMKHLNQDTVSPQSPWTIHFSDLTKSSFDFSEKIRRKESFIPTQVEDLSRKVLFILTHGTFGKMTTSFYDSYNPEDQNYRHIKYFASWYATVHKVAVDLVLFKWTGSLWDTPRFNAAEELKKYVDADYPEVPLVLIAHSHGCNIHNKFSQITKNSIELMIHLACPKRDPKEEKYYQPMNFKQLLYFHGKADRIEPAGRLTTGKALLGVSAMVGGIASLYVAHTFSPASIFFRNRSAGMAIIEKLLGPNAPFSQENVAKILPHVLPFLNEKGWGIIEFFADEKKTDVISKLSPKALSGLMGIGTLQILATKKVVPTLISENYFAPQDNAVVIGLKTKINGISLGHSQLIDVLKYLPDILENISTNYQKEALKSFTAQLDIQDPAANKKYEESLGLFNLTFSNVKVANDKHIPANQLPLHLQQIKPTSSID